MEHARIKGIPLQCIDSTTGKAAGHRLLGNIVHVPTFTAMAGWLLRQLNSVATPKAAQAKPTASPTVTSAKTPKAGEQIEMLAA